MRAALTTFANWLRMKPKSHKAADLLAAAPVTFMAIGDFHSDEFDSDYTTGRRYTLRRTGQQWDGEGNRMERLDMKLAWCLERWLAEGKVMLVEDMNHPARVGGNGVVQ